MIQVSPARTLAGTGRAFPPFLGYSISKEPKSRQVALFAASLPARFCFVQRTIIARNPKKSSTFFRAFRTPRLHAPGTSRILKIRRPRILKTFCLCREIQPEGGSSPPCKTLLTALGAPRKRSKTRQSGGRDHSAPHFRRNPKTKLRRAFRLNDNRTLRPEPQAPEWFDSE